MTEVHHGNAINTLDPKLEPNEAITVAIKDIYILASRCLLVDRRQRPTMEECSRFLWNVRKKYNDLIKKESNDNWLEDIWFHTSCTKVWQNICFSSILYGLVLFDSFSSILFFFFFFRFIWLHYDCKFWYRKALLVLLSWKISDTGCNGFNGMVYCK